MEQQQLVIDRLKSLDIPFEFVRHVAVFTIDEMVATGIEDVGEVCKNLFLRDAKGKKHFLVLIPGHKQANLALIAKKLQSGNLSFASEERLMRYLGLTKGAVTPFGVINDSDRAVTLVIDAEIEGRERLGFHPNVNTATVFLSFADLMKFINSCGNSAVTLSL